MNCQQLHVFARRFEMFMVGVSSLSVLGFICVSLYAFPYHSLLSFYWFLAEFHLEDDLVSVF